jgi:hypothetical protein
MTVSPTAAPATRETVEERRRIPTTWLARIALIAPAGFAALVALTDALQYDWLVSVGEQPLGTSPVSVNTWGPWGFLQVLAFFTLGIGVLALAVGLRRATRTPRTSVLSLLPLFVLGGGFLASTARCNCANGISTFKNANPVPGLVHGIAFLVIMLSLLISLITLWRRLRRVPGWRFEARWTLATACLMVPLFLVGMQVEGADHHVSGFYLFLLAVPLQWLTVLARRLYLQTR